MTSALVTIKQIVQFFGLEPDTYTHNFFRFMNVCDDLAPSGWSCFSRASYADFVRVVAIAYEQVCALSTEQSLPESVIDITRLVKSRVPSHIIDDIVKHGLVVTYTNLYWALRDDVKHITDDPCDVKGEKYLSQVIYRLFVAGYKSKTLNIPHDNDYIFIHKDNPYLNTMRKVFLNELRGDKIERLSLFANIITFEEAH